MLFESHKAEACAWLSGTEFLFFSTWRGEGLMLSPEKRESERQGQCRGAHLCTAGSEKLLPWVFILTLSLEELLEEEFAPEEQIDSP